MNLSYIIIRDKLQLSTIEEEKCNHETQSIIFKEKIIKKNNDFIKISYICVKCNDEVVTKWKKVGRFYLRNEL